MKKKINKPELDSFRTGFPKSRKPIYTKSGGAIGDDSMENMQEFLQAGSGVDETVEEVGSMPNEKFLNSNEKRNLSRGLDDGAGREVIE